jgi:hypothetical protein
MFFHFPVLKRNAGDYHNRILEETTGMSIGIDGDEAINLRAEGESR